MSLPRSLYKYEDIARDLHTILHTSGRRRVFSTPAKAQRWRMRAYMYRTLLEEQDNGSSLFNQLIFRITKAEPNVVTILTEPESDGWLEDADGNRIETMLTPEEAKMQEADREFARRHGFEEPNFAPKQRDQAPKQTEADYDLPDISPQSLEDLGL